MNALTLLAAVEFEGVERPWLWAIGLLCGAAVLFATYLGIVRRSDRRLGWWLMLLRGAGLSALVLMLAKPTWTSESDRIDAATVAVVIDDSASMGLADATGKPRLASAVAAVDALRAGIDADRAGGRASVEVFDLRAEPLGMRAPTKAAGDRTDLTRAVRETAARMRSRPLAAVVLISDGMDNTGREDFRDLADLPVPVHTLGFRDDPSSASMDLAVRKVTAPERAILHNTIKVDVIVAKTGGPAVKAHVTIRRGRETFATQPIDLPAGDVERTVSLSVTPSQAGQFVFEAVVASPFGERRNADNIAPFPLRVDRDPIRVLYIEGTLRYEFKYIKNRFEDDPDVGLLAVPRRINPGLGAARAPAALVTPERLKSFDVVILGDFEGRYLSDEEYRCLVAWLDGRGKALLVLGGYRSFGPEGLRVTPLSAVLPIVFADPGAPTQSEEPFTLELTEAGRRDAIFDLTGDRVRDAAAWAAAPPLQGCSLVKGVKPGAEVLAVNPNVRLEGKPAVVAAVQRVGAGTVMVLTADTTWRWSRFPRVAGRADTLFSRFWSQALRRLAGRSKDEDRPLIALSTDGSEHSVGKPVVIRAVRRPRPDVDLDTAEIAAEVRTPSGRPVVLPLRSTSAEPDVFLGTFAASAGGLHAVSAVVTKEGRPIADARAEFLVQGPDLETADPGTKPEKLRLISAATGGVALEVGQAASLAPRIERRERRTVRTQRREVWDSPGLFVFFLGAVGAEWFLRRRNHLI